MISPFETIGETIRKLEEIAELHEEAMEDPEFRDLEKPPLYLKVVKDGNLELAEKFKSKLGENGPSGGLYSEIICGTKPSMGCKECGFYSMRKGQTEKQCNFYGGCTPLDGTGRP